MRRGEGYQPTASGTLHPDFLMGRLDVAADYSAHPFLVIPEMLDRFPHQKVYRRKSRGIYQQPLLLIRAGFRYERNRGRALIVKDIEEVAYNESYFGLSCFGQSMPEQLADYLLLLFHSRFAFFYMLATSSQFGVERDAPRPEDIKKFLFVPLERLDLEQKFKVNLLARQMIETPVSPPWVEIDELIEEIYGLNCWDRQVIEDTLEMCLPDGTEEARRAANPSSPEQKKRFRASLFASMEPFFSVTGRRLQISLRDNRNSTPWIFIDVNATSQFNPASEELPRNILEKADDLMVSRIIHTWENHPGCLSVGILDQARYWTPTQARLLAADLLRNYGHQLEQGS